MKPNQPHTRLSLALGSALLTCTIAVASQRIPSISAVMHKQFTVSRSPFTIIKKEMEGRSPDWDKVQTEAVKFRELAALLEKNKPHSGTEDSWRESLAKLIEQADAMQAAAKSRDVDMLRSAHRKIAASCNAC